MGETRGSEGSSLAHLCQAVLLEGKRPEAGDELGKALIDETQVTETKPRRGQQ